MEVGGEEVGGGGVGGGGGGDGDVAARYERDLVHKLKLLRHELSLQQPQAGHCRIEVSREEIFEVSANVKPGWKLHESCKKSQHFSAMPTLSLAVSHRSDICSNVFTVEL